MGESESMESGRTPSAVDEVNIQDASPGISSGTEVETVKP